LIERKQLMTNRVVALGSVAALSLLLGSAGLYSTSFIPVPSMREANEVLHTRTSVVSISSIAILFVAAVRCWCFARLAQQKTQGLVTLPSSQTDLVPLPPP
jgi:hypothetical protein